MDGFDAGAARERDAPMSRHARRRIAAFAEITIETRAPAAAAINIVIIAVAASRSPVSRKNVSDRPRSNFTIEGHFVSAALVTGT
jgi:hypothetical protein